MADSPPIHLSLDHHSGLSLWTFSGIILSLADYQSNIMGGCDITVPLSTHSIRLTGLLRAVTRPTDPHVLSRSFVHLFVFVPGFRILGTISNLLQIDIISFCILPKTKLQKFLPCRTIRKEAAWCNERHVHGFWCQRNWVQVLTGIFKRYLTLGLLFNLPAPKFPIQKSKWG